jgi:hypothetical protein
MLLKNEIKKIITFIKRNIQKIIYLLAYNITLKQEKKIVIGVSEIANILYNMKSLFNDKCITVCINRNDFYSKNHYDIEFIRKKHFFYSLFYAYYLGKLAKNAICFIYLWIDGFFINRENDFIFLKKKNIPIVFNFLGDDIRSRKLYLNYCKSTNFNSYVEYNQPELFLSDSYDNEKKRLAEQADKYGTIIFSHKIDQYSYIQSYQQFFPPLINNSIFYFSLDKFDKKPLNILHAPSSPIIKGTQIVRSVIKSLQKEGYIFNYIEIINKPHEEVINELKKSHIVLNQFYAFIPGIFGLEAMATCNAVLMSAKSDQFPYQFNNAWLETEDWQVYKNLKFLLDNPNKIIKYKKNGYEYIKKNFSNNAIINHLNDIFIQHGIKIN